MRPRTSKLLIPLGVALSLCIAGCGPSSAPRFEAKKKASMKHRAALATPAAWSVDPTDQANARFADAIASAGDVDGNGYDDVIIGVWQYDGEAVDEGRAYLYLGSALGLSTTPAWFVDPTDQPALFGEEVAGLGDVNGDGYDDIGVGAALVDNENGDEGRAYVYYGGPTGPSLIADWELDPTDQTGAKFGEQIAPAGDVNGDGFDDVFVGAKDYTNEFPYEGRGYVFHGSASGLSTTPAWFLDPGDQIGAFFSATGRGVGDVNDDGFDDVAVGGFGWAGDGVTAEGKLWVYLGSPSGLSTTEQITMDPTDQDGASYSGPVAAAGDVNGDGFDDIVVGANGYDGEVPSEGRIYLYRGSASGISEANSWTEDPTNFFGSGFSVGLGGAGDVNGDGLGDIVVGARSIHGNVSNEGLAVVYEGNRDGIPTLEWGDHPTDQTGSAFGHSTTGAGDVNGDGLADVLVGARDFDAEAANEGRAYLYYGTRRVFQLLTPERSFVAGTCGGATQVFSVQLTEADGTPSLRGATLTASSTSPTGRFFVDATCATAAAAGVFQLPAGDDTVNLYYLDDRAGTAVLSVTNSQGITNPAAQTVTVVPNIAATLVFTSPPRTFVAGVCGGVDAAITVEVRDGFGNPTTAPGPIPFSPLSSSETGQWFADDGCVTPVSSFTIETGATGVAMFYRDDTSGPITVALESAIAAISVPPIASHLVDPSGDGSGAVPKGLRQQLRVGNSCASAAGDSTAGFLALMLAGLALAAGNRKRARVRARRGAR